MKIILKMSKKKAKFVVSEADHASKKSKHASLGKLSLSGRSKTIDKRKNTLLLEYKMKNKDNIFLDRRIGEKNRGMSQEEKVMARFTAEKIKAHSKKSIYNLNDDEILTHRGQSLMEIEKFDDPRSDEDDDDEGGDNKKSGKLDKKFMEDAHFGGGVLSRSANSEMSRKDMINQLIAESKKRKAEKQKLREETIGLTEKLDTEWRDLMPLLSFTKKGEEVPDKSGVDDYTKELHKMKFEPRGVPTDRLKSEEEIAKEEKSKLDELEKSRQERMKGFSDDVEFQQKHRSADDLDDFHIERIEDEASENENDLEGILKKYHESKAEKSKDEEKNVPEEENSDDDEDEDDEDDEEDEDCESEEDEEVDVDAKNDKKIVEENELSKKEEDASSENEESESEDNLSDLKASDSSEEEDKEEDSEKQEEKEINNTETQKNLVSEENLTEKDELIEKARKELPKTFEAPSTYEEMVNLLQNQSYSYQSVIIERIIKCNHWKSGEGNREKLSNLFSFLIKYLDNCASVNSLDELQVFFKLFDKLCPHLYDLVHANPLTTKNCLHDILKEKHSKFEEKIKVYPDYSTVRSLITLSIIL